MAIVLVVGLGYSAWSMIGGGGGGEPGSTPASTEAGAGGTDAGGGATANADGAAGPTAGSASNPSTTPATNSDSGSAAGAHAPAGGASGASPENGEASPLGSASGSDAAGGESASRQRSGASSNPNETVAAAPATQQQSSAVQQEGADSSTHSSEQTGPSGAGLQSDPQVVKLIRQGRTLIRNDQAIRARRMLSDALRANIAPSDARQVRKELTGLNKELIFSPEVHPEDPLTGTYIVKSGDRLVEIADKFNVTHHFLARINELENPDRLQVGWRLKVVEGPFDAVVHKEAFRLDVFLNDLYIRSFRVGLGEHNSTPIGRFVVKDGSKLSNPEWTNPRTGERVLADDPENPLGEYWIGLRGTDEKTRKLAGYGIHGTIEPETIGTEASMGCVRLAPESIELLYAMLTEGQSRVTIRK